MKSAGKILTFVSFFALGAVSAGASAPLRVEAWQLCNAQSDCANISAGGIKNIQVTGSQDERTVTLKATVTREPFEEGNWLFLGEVGDSVEIQLNGKEIFNPNSRLGRKFYFRYLSVFAFVPADFIQDKNELTFKITDFNQTLFGLRGELKVGSFPEILTISATDFLMRTGSSFLSTFALIFLNLAALIAFYFLKDKRLFYLFLYGVVSSGYLTSFSEVPRSFSNPILLSGPIHFSLRLLQDFSFSLLLLTVYRHAKRRRTRAVLSALYLSACAFLWIAYLRHQNFPAVKSVMFFCAPLVAFPSFYGFTLARTLPDIFERKMSTRFFTFLLFLQVNDLLVFWELIRGYFFVKWYIPLAFIFVLFILLRRSSIAIRDQAVSVRLGSEQKQFAHDIRPAITALKTSLLDARFGESENSELAIEALNRISQISDSVLRTFEESESCSVAQFLGAIDELVKFYSKTSQCAISVRSNIACKDSILPLGALALNRILQNLIQNSVESSGTTRVSIDIEACRRSMAVAVKDNGKGFSEETLAGLGQIRLTDKENGNGLGLRYCMEVVHQAKGTFDISNDKKLRGAFVQIEIPLNRKRSQIS